MEYKVLYRKYRPTNFDEIVGQNNTIELLKDSIINNKISHAYIFSGPRGTGKTSTAKIFAKAINCTNKINGNPCNKCQNCLEFANSNDIYEIDAASNNGVDQVREIIDNIKLAPINSKYKVYIIDEVHMLSVSAFNALLLTLEEPPSHVVFILATTDIEDVPITVLSRCQRLDFKKINNKSIVELLKRTAENENISINEDALNEIAEYADGGMRDALSMLDQLSKTNQNISREIILETIGLVSNQKIEDLITNIEQNKVKDIIEFVESAKSISADFKLLVKKTIQIIKQRAIKILEGVYQSRMGYKQYKDLSFELASLLYKNNINVDSYSLLELSLLSYTDKANNEQRNISREIKSNISQEEKLHQNKEQNIEKVPKNRLGNNLNTLVNIRINNCFVGANKKLLQANKSLWNKFIENLNNKKIRGMLLDTEIVLASDKILVIKADLLSKVDIINNNLSMIENEFNKNFDVIYNLIAISDSDWQSEMDKYKCNIKNNVKYEMMPEPEIEESSALDDIFSKQKIEIK